MMLGGFRPIQPRKRDGFWYLVRRVPVHLARLDSRTFARLSTGIRVADDPRCVVARQEVARLDRELQRYWRDLLAGRDPKAIQRYNWAVETAKKFGFAYVDQSDLEAGPLSELAKRIDAIEKLTVGQQQQVMPALWGRCPEPPEGTMLSEIVDLYEGIQATILNKKSPEQRRKWRNVRDLALASFLETIGGDKPFVELTEGDAAAYREMWKNRVLEGEVEIDTANKNIGRVAAMVRAVNEDKKLKLPDVFEGTRLKGGEDRQRVAYDVKYVQDVLLADGVMDGLNDEARAIFYVVAETGMRPSEVAGLTETTIHLDHEVPHVDLREEGRALKNKNSKRKMPLVGVALEVMKHFPKGFPHYRSRTQSLSTTINKYMRENGLRHLEGQSFYSLRHTFKDRLRGADDDSELRDALMGHATGKEKYGAGHDLKRKREVLVKMAFKAPRICFQECGVPAPSRHLAERAVAQARSGGRFSHKLRRVAVGGRLPP